MRSPLDELAGVQAGKTHETMPDHQGDCRPLSFRQRQELSRQFTQGAAVGHDVIRDPKAVEGGKQRQRVFGSRASSSPDRPGLTSRTRGSDRSSRSSRRCASRRDRLTACGSRSAVSLCVVTPFRCSDRRRFMAEIDHAMMSYVSDLSDTGNSAERPVNVVGRMSADLSESAGLSSCEGLVLIQSHPAPSCLAAAAVER